ncbi:MAG: 16S rRNA (adenine(1518)-N(6)/adenine(1519)-N(6))-dimethyltransferase RsmA [Rickettsiaceae bacterium]|nr:MAG: 16S rRNA (adenine(1518)-N(6)/adenine(1519)-N(6))-dimethyltransferase RsmA [Rickettsiaceae bacterium]
MPLLSIAKEASKYGITPNKKYSQNFIFDSNLCDKIVKVSQIVDNDHIFEVGPGTAGLTRSILSNSPNLLTVIEIDKRCIALLDDLKNYFPNLKVLNEDALSFDLANLESKSVNIISNLPYQIGTELVIKWLKKAKLIRSMTLMLQKEVVDRMKAKIDSKAYGRLSVICQLVCDIEKCFDVASKAFYPAPKVHSAIVRLVPKAHQINNRILDHVSLVTKSAFGQRRKMLKSSLKDICTNIEDILTTLSIPFTSRAENLSPTDYLNIAQLTINDQVIIDDTKHSIVK